MMLGDPPELRLLAQVSCVNCCQIAVEHVAEVIEVDKLARKTLSVRK